MNVIPASVYRIQLGKNCSLRQATAILPYLSDLGVDGIYTSPIFDFFQSGYDIINPNRLNPILGTEADFVTFCETLQKYGMAYLLDIVPNHMEMKGNLWWQDVLEKGPESPYAHFFDIKWEMSNKILLPILNEPYGQLLKKGLIQLIWKEGFWVRYADYLLPICYSSYHLIITALSEVLKEEGKEWIECLIAAKTGNKELFVILYQRSKMIQKKIAILIDTCNQDPNLLHELLETQFYRLSYWQVASQEVNYRRFFNINDLVAINIEKEAVLNTHHQWIFDLLKQNKVQGLRIDHPDGLYNPKQYFKRIRHHKPHFVWAEKILDFGESLPKWQIDGTVGYDFVTLLSGIFVEQKNEQKMTHIYEQFIGEKLVLKQVLYERRKKYITLQMMSEMNQLGLLLKETANKNWMFQDFTFANLTRACLEIVACFPVYRTYIEPDQEIQKNDRRYILYAIESAKKKNDEIDASHFDYIKRLLLLDIDPNEQESAIDFVLRFQQLTPVVMAKGLEDSVYFLYNRLISLNEVGGNPERFGYSKEDFHTFNEQKLKHWPLGALATSTHDTKFSEDARLRLHVLSEIPQTWKSHVTLWKKQNERYKTVVDGVLFPDPNTEYYLYQMLLAIWPAEQDRLWECLKKAIREAGIFTSWRRINEPYEKAVEEFLKSILKPKTAFFPCFKQLQKKIAHYGLLNSLSAVVLKIGSCGIVDIYQGNEALQFCLTDPDNRRPINYAEMKQKLKNHELKISVTQKALNFRKKHKELFLKGKYIELKSPENVIAFLRKKDGQEAMILASRFFTEKDKKGVVKLPKHIKTTSYRELFTQREVKVRKCAIELKEVFKEYPFAILESITP